MLVFRKILHAYLMVDSLSFLSIHYFPCDPYSDPLRKI